MWFSNLTLFSRTNCTRTWFVNRGRSYWIVLAAWCLYALTDIAYSANAAIDGAPSGGDRPSASTVPARDQPASDNALVEIVVTAEKREQSINKVGATIQAVTTSDLREQQISSLQDLALVVPGLQYANTNFSTPVYTLRGVGFYDSSLSAYPDVTIYVDQIPLPFPALTLLTNFDLAQVEVLKGPQGTLFGSNATGGAINYIAAKPTAEFTDGAAITYGRFNDTIGEGFISGPLADNLNFRLAGRFERMDDWQESYTRSDTIGAIDTKAARFMLDWRPSDTVKMELNINGWEDLSKPQQPQLVGLSIQNPGFAPPYELNYPLAPHDPRAADWDPNLPLRNHNSLFQTSLRTDINLTDTITLTSLSSYVNSTRDSYAGAGGVSFENADYHQTGTFKDAYQEVRIANSSSSATRWTIGVNDAYDDVHESDSVVYSQNSLFFADGISESQFIDNVNSNTYAAFANLEQDIMPNLTLKVGGRFTEIKRTAYECDFDGSNGKTAAFFTYLESVLNGGKTFPPIGLYGCYTLNPANYTAGPYFDTLREHNLSYRAGLDWRINDELLLYFNTAKGYKAGGFPATAASTWVSLLPVTQESLVDYEAGFKAQIWDRRISLTGSIFHYDYKDKQLRSKVAEPVFGDLDATVNIPKSTVKGLELSVGARPLDGLSLSLSATYMDATIDEYVGLNNAGVQGDFAGTRMPYAPQLQVAADAEYKWAVARDWTAFVGANVSHSSDTNAVVGATPLYNLPAYTLLGLRAGADHGKWRYMLWGKNVTNEYYFSNVIQSYDLVTAYTGMPRTYGLTVGYNY